MNSTSIVVGLVLGLAVSVSEAAVYELSVDPGTNPVGAAAELAASIDRAQQNEEADTVVLFAEGVYAFDGSQVFEQLGRNALPALRDTVGLVIEGNGATLRRLETAPDFRMAHIDRGGRIEIRNITIENGKAVDADAQAASGGNIHNYGRLTLRNCVIRGGTASHVGGGIANGGGEATLVLEDCVVENNRSECVGGGLDNVNGIASVIQCRFAGNSAAKDAGAIGSAGYLDLGGCTFEGNTCGWAGGAIRNLATMTAANCQFQNNEARSVGGAVANQGREGFASLEDCLFLSNQSGCNGGALDNRATVRILNSRFTTNVAGGNGGAIGSAGTLEIVDSTLVGNGATDGGAIINHQVMTARKCILYENQALSSGGAITDGRRSKDHIGDLVLDGCSLTRNEADSDDDGTGDGGALHIEPNANSILKSCQVYENSDAGNEAPDIHGTWFSNGMNLVSSADGNRSLDRDYVGEEATGILQEMEAENSGNAPTTEAKTR